MVGKSIAHYEIKGKLGKGGMGEVYRATDTKLNRDVALKVLPDDFALDEQRMARFSREAQVLASVSHPNIAGIFGLEEAEGKRALVLELVEGEDLSQMIARGPLQREEALTLALQMAEALEWAHEHGIIHRDLKPANIKVTPDGTVKVLDFGLAKAMESKVEASDPDASPTMSIAATRAGIILGTAAYMAPEQARGKTVDRRADIFAFGVVLFEMLTGRRAFQGEDISLTLAAVMKDSPDWDALPGVPPALKTLLERCLEKDPRERLQAIGEARIALKKCLQAPDSEPAPTGARPSSTMSRFLAVLSLVLAIALVTAIVWPGGTSAPPSYRLALRTAPSDGLRIGSELEDDALAISPDGGSVVFSGKNAGTDNDFYLFIRDLSSEQARLIPGTENARAPFFSPDGTWIGFTALGELKKVPARGGSVITLSSSPRPEGAGTWGEDGAILFGSPDERGIWRVSAGGGKPERLTQATTIHVRPHLLPGGRFALFSNLDTPGGTIDLLDLESREHRSLLQGGSAPVFSPTGHLLYTSGGRLLAAPFDPDRGALLGPALPVVDDLARGVSTERSHFALSQSGTLVVLPQWAVGTVTESLVWVEPTGAVQPLENAPPASYLDPRLSPQGDRVAINIPSMGGEIWVRDLARGTQMRLTNSPTDDETPVWSPDGRWIVFSSGGTGAYAERTIRRMRADGAGSAEVIWTHENHMHASDWSRDGKQLLVDVRNPETQWDIWIVEIEGEARALVNGPSNESLSRFSPDGRYLAFTSDQSGRNEVYVQPYPGLESRVQISTDGGTEPVWSRDGKRLFYLQQRQMMAVDISAEGGFAASRPAALFESRFGYARGLFHFGYDVAADGRFLMPSREGDFYPSTLRVSLNWFDELRRLVPTPR